MTREAVSEIVLKYIATLSLPNSLVVGDLGSNEEILTSLQNAAKVHHLEATRYITNPLTPLPL